jgi:hypothetical protein
MSRCPTSARIVSLSAMFNRQPRLTISAAGKDEEGDDMAADLDVDRVK